MRFVIVFGIVLYMLATVTDATRGWFQLTGLLLVSIALLSAVFDIINIRK